MASYRSELVDERNILLFGRVIVNRWKLANGVSEIVVEVHVHLLVVESVYCPSQRTNVTTFSMECLCIFLLTRVVRVPCRNDNNNNNSNNNNNNNLFL